MKYSAFSVHRIVPMLMMGELTLETEYTINQLFMKNSMAIMATMMLLTMIGFGFMLIKGILDRDWTDAIISTFGFLMGVTGLVYALDEEGK